MGDRIYKSQWSSTTTLFPTSISASTGKEEPTLTSTRPPRNSEEDSVERLPLPRTTPVLPRLSAPLSPARPVSTPVRSDTDVDSPLLNSSKLSSPPSSPVPLESLSITAEPTPARSNSQGTLIDLTCTRRN